ncbi:uncharacterized protein K452DRAFT_192456, partial [Aplosporella prunicola CBS 121167]
ETFRPTQDEYPVYYFFYGTLAEPQWLKRILNLPEMPILKRATIHGGTLKMWGPYKALINGPETIQGWAYLVQNKKHETRLCEYETPNYEVVRCKIRFEEEGEVPGCVFRFVDQRQL